MNKELKGGLVFSIKESQVNRNEFIWIGIVKNLQARKYKYELYYFDSCEHLVEEDDILSQFENSNSRICQSQKEAFAYGYYFIKKALENNPKTQVYIDDLTE